MRNKTVRIAHIEPAAKPAMDVFSFFGMLLLAVAAVLVLYLVPVELLMVYMALGFVVTALYWIWRN